MTTGASSMAPRRVEISETELEVLKALWEAGSATVRELHERLSAGGRVRAYTTVLTFLMRLEAKGYVASDDSGVAHVFRPIVSREALLRRKLVSLADDLCDGTATPLMRALVQGRRFSAAEIDQFRRLLDELEHPPRANQPPSKPKRRR
jgi:predicted transcriptional regulator